MEQIKDGGPAFPGPDQAEQSVDIHEGMTLRQYAAIHLRVPDSGQQWLDDMIRKAERNELAAKAMQGMLADLPKGLWGLQWEANTAACAYKLADAMLTAQHGMSRAQALEAAWDKHWQTAGCFGGSPHDTKRCIDEEVAEMIAAREGKS